MSSYHDDIYLSDVQGNLTREEEAFFFFVRGDKEQKRLIARLHEINAFIYAADPKTKVDWATVRPKYTVVPNNNPADDALFKDGKTAVLLLVHTNAHRVRRTLKALVESVNLFSIRLWRECLDWLTIFLGARLAIFRSSSRKTVKTRR